MNPNTPFSLAKLNLPIKRGEYLLDALDELGPFHLDGMAGPVQQSWTEVVCYGKVAEHLTNAELVILHALSGEWVNGFRQGKTPLSRSPIEALQNG